MHRSDHIRAIKSVGNSATTPRDLVSDDDVRLMLYLLAESVACRMRELASKCTVVEVAVRDTELHWYCICERCLRQMIRQTLSACKQCSQRKGRWHFFVSATGVCAEMSIRSEDLFYL